MDDEVLFSGRTSLPPRDASGRSHPMTAIAEKLRLIEPTKAALSRMRKSARKILSQEQKSVSENRGEHGVGLPRGASCQEISAVLKSVGHADEFIDIMIDACLAFPPTD